MKNNNQITIKICFALCIIFQIFISNNLLAQVRYQHETTKSIITAEADNYFPKLNEPVKIQLEITSPYDVLLTDYKVGFVFRAEDSIKIVEGSQWESITLKKGEVFKKEIVVKFTQPKTCNTEAYFNKSTNVWLAFYVEGSFQESMEVEDLRENISLLRDYINKIDLGLEPEVIASVSNIPSKVKEQTIQPYNEYDKSKMKEAQEWNSDLFNKLKVEYDSLYITVLKLKSKKEKAKRDKGNRSSEKNNNNVEEKTIEINRFWD